MKELIESCWHAYCWIEKYWNSTAKGITQTNNKCMKIRNRNMILIRVRYGQLLEEIEDFSLVPPSKEGGVCGYTYKKLYNKYKYIFSASQ